jgi:Leucine-rich repeat (LRR) protein
MAAWVLSYTSPVRAETEVSCGYFGCEVKGPLDAAAVAKIKQEASWNAKPLRFYEDATDADLKTIVLLKDELLGLDLSNCKKLTDLSALAAMTKLETLKLDRAEGVTDFSPVGKIKTLKVLHLNHLKLKNIDFMKELKDLEDIAFFQPDESLTDISALAGHTKLKRAIFYAYRFQDLGPLKDAAGMTDLSLYSTKVNDLSPLKAMKGLRDLDLYACPVTDLSPLAELTELTKLNLYFLDKVQDFSPLAKLTKMENLDLTFTKFKDLEHLLSLPNLKRLMLWKCPIEAWAPLAKLTGLTELNVADTSFADPSLLAGMQGLKTLVIENCPQFKDLDPLKSLPALESLRLRGTPVDVANAELFKGFPKLKYVALSNKQVSAEQVAKMKEAAPGLNLQAY